MTNTQKQNKNKGNIPSFGVKITKNTNAVKEKKKLKRQQKQSEKSRPLLDEKAEMIQKTEKQAMIQRAKESISEKQNDPDYDPSKTKKKKK